jgi:hypothetical protein
VFRTYYTCIYYYSGIITPRAVRRKMCATAAGGRRTRNNIFTVFTSVVVPRLPYTVQSCEYTYIIYILIYGA